MIKTWNPTMTDKETADLAYWERNMLALYYAYGWYNDDVEKVVAPSDSNYENEVTITAPRFEGWRRVLTLADGTITFHIPNDFDVGDLPEVAPNWDGHTTEDKWRRLLNSRGIEATV